ncbi:MAG: hypothetical protein Q8N23_22715 [Archangium sp.]|nr:hypothetical protein [Archangium sp.]MDP3155502.1 hypothetical protein [Archangium sp.]MDP3573834.1 hypothetical protein [Archangium sp.]
MRALGLAALAITACGVDARLTTERESYQSGESVTLTLTNRSLAPVGYNLCFVELLAPEGTAVAHPKDGTFCVAILEILEGGRWTTGTSRPLPAGLQEGRYRYRTQIEGPDGARETLESTPFLLAP